MATLQAIIDEIQDQVGAISGIRGAPDEPPDSINAFPFAVAYVESGEYLIGPPQVMTGLHTIIVELHVARKDLKRDVAQVMLYAKSVPNAIFAAHADSTFTAFQTLTGIRYEFGPLDWGDLQTIGFRFRLEGVKSQDEIT